VIAFEIAKPSPSKAPQLLCFFTREYEVKPIKIRRHKAFRLLPRSDPSNQLFEAMSDRSSKLYQCPEILLYFTT
jgi:hypothetical protein